MPKSLAELIDDISLRNDEIAEQMGDPVVVKNADKMRSLGRDHRRFSEILEVGSEYKSSLRQIEEAKEIIADGDDPELIELAQEDLDRLKTESQELEERVRDLLVPADPNDRKSAIVEIHAGTGGEEAGLFAADLMRMYVRFAENQGWKVDMLGSSATGVGGFKEVTFAVEGDGVFGTLKYESGVHRVQRVPAT